MNSVDCREPPVAVGGEPVAIVGMGCRWPGDSESPSALWDFLQERRTAYGRFPENRIKTDSFYHPTPGRPGSFYTEGGCFLKSDVRMFDYTFFGINSKEVMSMDPAQRKLLEVVYEAFESSGNFGYDHQLMNYRDPEYPEPYSVTGGGVTILSNRINYIFDLKGPSLTVDTACSGSMYALHLACSAIQAGDCTAAVVGGSNLVLTPDNQISSCSLGAVSKTSVCHTFDASADGYARADGIAALYVKKLSKAVEDGDPIRAVIRATSANANGRTGGVTHPSPDGQEAVIRRAYERVGLDPSLTGYFECHGTGTAVGDPVEVSAIGRVFESHKSKDAPLLIGSIKTNLGHSEPTSGLAGVMKVVLAIERGIIPPTVNLRTLNPNLDLKDGRIKIVTESTKWPDLPVRRASVNAFGYGGSNAHAIIESVEGTMPGYRSRNQAERNESTSTIDSHATISDETLDGLSRIPPKLLLVFTAHDEKTLKANITALGNVADRWKLTDLAFTLSERRSILSHRAFAVTDANRVKEDLQKSDWNINKTKASSVAKLGFVFTGQGAQWSQMGLHLMARFPSYMATIQRLDGYLDELDDERPWQILGALQSEDATVALAAELSQPLVTALQIALVNLLREWNITPSAVVGHSSGEIAAAYAAGLTTERQAIIAAYLRGKAVARNTRKGSMLAVQSTVAEADEYLRPHSDRVVVACYNSPKSLTLSGDVEAIARLKEQLQSEGKLAKILRTGDNAYHSNHMVPLGGWYEEKLSVHQDSNTTNAMSSLGAATGPDRCSFYSSVYGEEYQDAVVDASYFRRNLESPVKFLQAVNLMVTSTALDALVEIGPHSTLEGPLRQIREHVIQGGSKFPDYLATIIRNSDNSVDLLNLAGKLFIKGYPVDVARIDSVENPQRGHPYGRTIVDLPPYQWCAKDILLTENRWSREWRQRFHPRHDILGSRQPGGSRTEPVWRNVLRHHDLPWLKDHSLGQDAVFPAAGYLCLALEAVTQVVEVNGRKATDIESYEFYNVSLQSALMIPGDGGVETLFAMKLKPLNKSQRFRFRYDFTLESVVGEEFREHCRGTIEVRWEPQAISSHPLLEEVGPSALKRPFNIAQCYKQFASVGLHYGPAFQGLSDIKVVGPEALSEAKIALQPTAKLFSHESRYVIHPAALDTALQLSIVAAHHKENIRFEKAFLPVSFDQIRVYPKAISDMTTSALTLARSKFAGVRGLTADLAIMSPDARTFIEVSNALLIGTDQGIIRTSAKNDRPYARIVWKPDLDGLNEQSIAALYPPVVLGDDAVIPLLNNLALHQITEFRVSNPQLFMDMTKVPHLRRLLEWIEDKLRIVENDPSSAASAIIAATPEWRKSRILELEDQLCPVSPEACLMARLYRNLPAIYYGETTGIEVAVQDNLLHDTYEAGQACREGNKRLASVLSLLGHKYPGIRIFEVGAGTGSATREALPALNGNSTWRQFTEYRFTDVTPSFLVRAEESFQSYDGLSFGVFDMEQSASEQGYTPEWDVVMAANTVHATSDIKSTLCNLRSLLKPGGKLLLLEITRSQLTAGLLMGTFSDYWKGDQDLEYPRFDGPFLSKAMWRDVLPKAGYEFDFFLDDYSGDNASTTVICATAVEARLADPLAQPTTEKPGLTLVYRNGPSSFSQSLTNHLSSQGISVSGVCLSQVPDFVYTRFIFLVEIEEPLFQNISPAEWSGLQKCISFAQSILWVTNGSLIRGREPLFAMVSGLARGLQSETTNLRFHILDLDNELCESTAVLSLVGQHEELAATGNLTDDTEFRRKDGVTYISRLAEDDELNNNYQVQLSRKSTPQHIPFADLESTPFRLDIEKPGVLSTIYFRPDPDCSASILDDEVEIKVRAVGINNKDIAVLTGSHHENSFSDECAGVITKVGQKVSNLKPGDSVYCASFARFGNFIREKAIFCQKIRPRDTFEACATLPIAFCTAVYGLLHLGRLQKGESVLIQSATGAVGIAACQIAKMRGAEIWATVGSVEKKRALLAMGFGIQDDHILHSRDQLSPRKLLERRRGRGMDVILCSARGELFQEYWNSIALNGRFIDIGRTEVLEAGTLDMNVFRRNVTFTSFDLELLSKDRPEIIGQLMAEVHTLYELDIIQPIIYTKYHLSEIDTALKAFTKAAHIGKLVVSYEGDEESTIRYLHSPFTFAFDPNACYLLVGCLGGLGRAFSRWAVQQGARHLMYLSRSGAASVEAKSFVQELQACGAEAQIVQGDVEILEDVEKAIQQARYPIRGVVQGALSLNDGLFESLSLEGFQATVGPRVTGTLNLHQALKDSPLDFFEMWSSWTAIFGTATQCNYLASNTFMDAFSRYRQSLGLPGSSVSLSQISGIGVVSHDPRYHQSMMRNGLYGTHEHEFLSFCEAGLLSSPTSRESSAVGPTSPAHLLAGIEPAGLQEVSREYPLDEMIWSGNARFRNLLQATRLLSIHGGEITNRDNGNADGEETSLTDSIRLRISKLLHVPLEEVEAARPLKAYGIDSMVAAELRNWFSTQFGVDIQLLHILDQSMTIEGLAQKVESGRSTNGSLT